MKFDTRKLSDLCIFADGRASCADLNLDNYISTENMLPNKKGITRSAGLPSVLQTKAYQEKDVLVSNIRPYFHKIWFADRKGGCSNDILVFRALDNCCPSFLYYVLSENKRVVMSFAEANYENAVIELFRDQLGYAHCYGPDVTRDCADPLYDAVLLPSLRQVNPHSPEAAINEAIFKLRNFEGEGFVQKNSLLMDYLQNGISINFFDKGKQSSALVRLIDFQNISCNNFVVCNQWTIVENSEKRPDVIIFINGLPLIVFELKSPSREETDISEAYRQLRNYVQEIPSLFIYNAFCVISDLALSKAGTRRGRPLYGMENSGRQLRKHAIRRLWYIYRRYF